MSLENLMIRISILLTTALIIIGCASTEFTSYNCKQFDEEPIWVQVALDAESEKRLKIMVEAHYSKPQKNAYLMNGNKNKKYFWYEAESGEILACIVDKKMWEKYSDGCFADRIIINKRNGEATLKVTESIVCT